MGSSSNFRRAAGGVVRFAAGLLASAGMAFAPAAHAQQVNLPPIIKIVVPFTAGGSNDLIARLIAAQLGPRINRTVIVENKPGASTFIGADYVARAPKDGSVLLGVSVSMITAAATKPNLPIDVLKDLAPVVMFSESPMLIVASNKSGIKTPADLVAAARAKPDIITHGSPGSGTISHLSAEMLNDSAKIQIKHIPYKGGAQAMNDVMGGFVDIGIGYTAGPIMPLIQAGKMQLVAVTSLEPSPAFPGVPPMSTAVPGYDATIWQGIWAPAGTPAPIIAYLNREIIEAVKAKEIVEALKVDGAVALSLTPAESDAKIRKSLAIWKDVATKKSIVAD